MKQLCRTTLLVAALLASCVAPGSTSEAQELPLVMDVEFQPLSAQAVRVVQALEHLGAPLTGRRQDELQVALESTDSADGVKRIQQVLDPLCLVGVNINPESRVKARPGAASRQLMQQGWRMFLVKVHNEAGVTARLRCDSPNASKMHDSKNDPEPRNKITPRELTRRWLDVNMYDGAPMVERLSGLEVEYRIVELFSRDMGKREARLVFDVGQGTQDLGFRNEVNLLFNCEPCVDVRIEVLDHDGKPTTGNFTFRDQRGRVYPARARRLAPDFFFHDQVYRSHGDTMLLPAGDYTVDYTRGPEYRLLQRVITVPSASTHTEQFRLELDLHGAGRVAFGGPPRTRGRMFSLFLAYQGSGPGRHDAAHLGRRFERRLRVDVGTLLVSSKKVLSRRRARLVDASARDALRCRSLGLSQFACWALGSLAARRG